ncbi:protoporphyrinogen oxidase [Alkalicoccus chagannorensis]|uniref:protoporphyrinogen oxidase n=1 Tax=Alkalicoccus chagannorensis TaxID=427072 RepID=UPI0003F59137|nr:protoporphyrinogen oxidase [Alkalicoccus chagannorensis]
MENKKTVVVGGGITGLSAAYFLNQKGIDIELYEASGRLGGSIYTERKGGYVIERGPDSFLARKRSLYNLAAALGIADELETTKAGAYILHRKKLHRIPAGAVMGIPTKWRPFLSTGLFTPAGKLRAAMDMVLPGSRQEEEESVGSFFRRRLGNEVVDHMIEPLLSGVYAGNIDHLSLEATFPQFREVEDHHRSLILGMKKTMGEKAPEQDPILLGPEQKPAGMFLTFRRGLETLTEKLAEQLPSERVHLHAKLISLEKEDGRYRLHFADGSSTTADHVLMTLRHHDAAPLFEDLPSFHEMQQVPSTSVATAAMTFRKSDLPEMEGSGFLVPKKEGYTITACTWTHLKWPHTAPEGGALLRAYVGRPGEEAVVDESDEKIKEIVLKDLFSIMGVKAKPEHVFITRYRNAMPQYQIGHKQRLDELQAAMEETYPGVEILGASFRGIGMPDCVTQAEKAASRIAHAQQAGPTDVLEKKQ